MLVARNPNNANQLTWAFLAAFDLALLILWVRRSTFKTNAAIPSAVISFVGSLVLCLLSYFEHLRTVRTSFLLNVYLFFTILFDAARSRSYSLDNSVEIVSVLFTTRVGVKLFLAIFEARSKRHLLLPEYKEYPPEATSGVYNRALFWWQNQLFRNGFSNTLTVDDLFHLDKHLRSDYLQRQIESAWNTGEFLSLFWGGLLVDFADVHVIGSDRQRIEYTFHCDPKEAQMVHPRRCSSSNVSDCFQLLSTVPDRQSYQVF